MIAHRTPFRRRALVAAWWGMRVRPECRRRQVPVALDPLLIRTFCPIRARLVILAVAARTAGFGGIVAIAGRIIKVVVDVLIGIPPHMATVADPPTQHVHQR